MNKLLFAITLAGTLCLAACGANTGQKAATEKAKNDSITAIRHTDSLMAALKQQNTEDSIKAAQSKAADTNKPANNKFIK